MVNSATDSVSQKPSLDRQTVWPLLLRVALPPALCLVLFSTAVFAIVLPGLEQSLLSRKKEMIRELSQTVWTTLARYERRAASGELTREEAQQRALAYVRNLRYGSELKDYFWINDLEPRMLLHPYRPDLEQQDLSDYVDPTGKRLFVEAVKTVRDNGAGYVDYMWQWKDDPQRIVPKLSYVQLFRPWGWVIGTGIYVDDVQAEISAITRQLAWATGLTLLIVALLSSYVVWHGSRAESQRWRAEQRVKLLSYAVEQVSEGIGLADLGGNILFANEALARMHGYSPNELLGHSLRMLYPSDELPRVEQLLDRLRAGVDFTGEIRQQHRNGHAFPALLHASLVCNRAGEPAALVGTVTDISATKRTEQSLRESQQRLATLMSNLPGMVYRCRNEPGWPMEFVSEGCQSLTGYRPEELSGDEATSYADLIHPAERQRVWDEVQRALQQRQPFRLTYRLITAGGTEKWVWEQGQGIVDEHGRLTLLEGLVIDITDRKRAEDERNELQEQLHQAQKMEAIGQLAGGVAHDFNNLLTVILGGVDQVRQLVVGAEHGVGALSAIERAADQATGMTRSLLTFSHNMPTDKRRLDLRAVVRRSMRLLERLLPASIELSVQVDAEEPLWLNADDTQLQQVILNLAINARDAMPSGGTLRVSAGRATPADIAPVADSVASASAYVRLVVGDTGLGMSPEVQARVFEPFYTTKPRGEGTGLGLAIVHSVIEDHGGHVSVKSSLGAGSTFTIILPSADAVTPLETSHVVAQQTRGNGQNIYLVEDNRPAREIMAAKLTSLGYRVTQYDDGTAALANLSDAPEPPDMFVLDIDLPKCSGLDVLRQLRKRGNDAPVLFITGGPTPEIAEDLRPRMSLLRKPFQMAELGHAVARMLATDSSPESG